MRNGQNKRMRGRGNQNRKSQNPLTRVYESNGPDLKIRGTASHIADKYSQLARDAQTSGDPVAAENYYQHAEHYYRLIAAAQEQFRQQNPYYRPEGEARSDDGDEAEEGGFQGQGGGQGGEQPAFGGREPQPFIPRDAQPFPQQNQPYQPREGQAPREGQPYGGRPQQQHQPSPRHHQDEDVGGLPSFITGGGQPQGQGESFQQAPRHQNGHDGQPDRFPLHRRRRRHRGPRGGDQPGGAPHMHGDAGDEGPA